MYCFVAVSVCVQDNTIYTYGNESKQEFIKRERDQEKGHACVSLVLIICAEKVIFVKSLASPHL